MPPRTPQLGPEELDALLPGIYDELRSTAARLRRRYRIGDAARPTSIVHEAWMRMRRASLTINSEAHLAAAAAVAMRSVLVDRARRSAAIKRGGSLTRVVLTEVGIEQGTIELLALDDALKELSSLHQRAAEVVHLRFFGGLEMQEIATLLEISQRTAERDWRMARAWLVEHLTRQ